MQNFKKFFILLVKSIVNPQQFFYVFNQRFLISPSLKSLHNIKNKNLSKRYYNFWINLSKKNMKFKKIFFDNESLIDKIKINYQDKNHFDKFFFKYLSSNGIVVLENILPESEKNIIKNNFINLKKFDSCIYTNQINQWLKRPVIMESDTKKRIYSKKGIKEFPNLKKISDELTKKISGRALKTEAEFFYDICIKTPENIVRGDNNIHIDRFLPNFKIIYSPFEVGIEDAPFTYLLGSHKINKDHENLVFKKIPSEIDKIINFNFKNKKIKITLKENSLIVALTNGLHGRSPFTQLNERMLLFLQYNKSFNKLAFLNYKNFNK